MKNSFYLFLLILGFTEPLSSQSINESLVKKHIYTLANDSMQGRKAGTEGIEKAAKYIEGQFKKIGLKYFNKDNLYFKLVPAVTDRSFTFAILMPVAKSGKAVIVAVE